MKFEAGQRLLVGLCFLNLCLNPPTACALESQGVRRSPSQKTEITPKLRKVDRARLLEAMMEGKREVTLVIASAPGANAQVAIALQQNGGRVTYRADEVSYLRAKVSVDSVERIARLAEIEALSVDGQAFYESHDEDRTVDLPQTGKPSAIPAPDRKTPAENPYLPTRDIGAPQFLKQNPTYDGRGVTIAVVEGLADFLCPELQSAFTLDGKPTRKIVDVLSSLDPAEDDYPGMLRMKDQVSAVDGRFAFEKTEYVVPADGTYRVAFFDEGPFDYFNGDVNRDGNPAGSSRLFAVLWDESTNTTWVDTNQNRSFADERPMLEYGARFDFGVFGQDNPATPQRESMSFAVKPYPEVKAVGILLAGSRHNTTVASVASGHGFFGGRMNGAAPGSQLVMVGYAPVILHSVIEAMILAAKHPKVDIITVQVGSEGGINDGRSTASIIWDRIAERYQKPIFVAAGNGGPGLNSIGELGAGRKVFSVSGYIHKDTWRSNWAVLADDDDYLMDLSARGPASDGGLKPDIVAPVNMVAAIPAFYPGRPVKGTFSLPPGYRTVYGTSFSSPMAAGGTALLISAAKQARVRYDDDLLKWAIKSSARFMPKLAAYEQGAGLMQVGAAWEAMRNAPTFRQIEIRAPVKTPVGDSDKGRGIYERESWVAGQTGSRAIVLTRRFGPRYPVSYRVIWVGNDGTFRTADTVNLPLNNPITLRVSIDPKTSGAHSALLNLTDPKSNRPVIQIMNTVIAAEGLRREVDFKFGRSGRADWLRQSSYFFHVPPLTPVINFDLKNISGNVRVYLCAPTRGCYDGNRVIRSGLSPAPAQTGGEWNRAIANPEAGVWELMVKNSNTSRDEVLLRPQSAATFTISASLLGATPHRLPARIDVDTEEESTATISLTNRFAPFTNPGPTRQPLGSAVADRPSFSVGSTSRVYEVDVSPGSANLMARISRPTDPKADLDLYLFDCTKPKCVRVDQGTTGGSEETVAAVNPSPGKWKVVIDAFKVLPEKTAVSYVDVFTNNTFGELMISETVTDHTSFASWTCTFGLHLNSGPAVGRNLAVVIDVTGRNVETVEYWIKPESAEVEGRRTSAALATVVIPIKVRAR